MPLLTQPLCDEIVGSLSQKFPYAEHQAKPVLPLTSFRRFESALVAFSVISVVHSSWGAQKHIGKMRHGPIPAWDKCFRRHFIFLLLPFFSLWCYEDFYESSWAKMEGLTYNGHTCLCTSRHTRSVSTHPESPWLLLAAVSFPRFRSNSAS